MIFISTDSLRLKCVYEQSAIVSVTYICYCDKIIFFIFFCVLKRCFKLIAVKYQCT